MTRIILLCLALMGCTQCGPVWDTYECENDWGEKLPGSKCGPIIPQI